MNDKLTIYGFETSNNMKVRVALGFKGLDYDFISIKPAERAEILRLSGQHLTPVMTHGDRVLFDSAAILRYLDANFPETPKLYGDSRDEEWAIEDWELFGRLELARPMMTVVHRKVSGKEVSEELQADCQREFDGVIRKLVGALEGKTWLIGDRMTAADVTVAPVLYRIRAASFFDFVEGSDVLEDYVARVMKYDAGPEA